MMFTSSAWRLLALMSICLLADSALAGSNMKTGGVTTQPVGHHDFCIQYPSECTQRSADKAPIEMSRKLWSVMQKVNNAANLSIEPITDQDLWGISERWSFPDKRGDCEDYVLVKRKALMDLGVSASSLLITVVRQQNGDGHAVLTVRTSRGDFVLDNLEPKILLWNQTDYRFLKRQSEFDSGQWVSVSDGRAPIVGSVN
jgi:predicted transglutaminase-like cysteine proteinase